MLSSLNNRDLFLTVPEAGKSKRPASWVPSDGPLPGLQMEAFLLCPYMAERGSKPSHLFFSSVQFSHSVASDSLQPHELQHARPPCPSPTPGVYSNSCPSSR